jgi:hypothetical protein
MIAIAPWVAVLIAIATIAWLVLFVRALVLRRPATAALTRDERALLVMTLVLAVLWTAVAPPWSVGVSLRSRDLGSPHGCGAVRENLSATNVRELLGVPSRKVSEDDVRGPGAAAWVYDEQRCIVHLMGERVVAVEEDF